jgi:glyoxylase-like metal-dependent hydrolase (beta-lactamase superfamily II)
MTPGVFDRVDGQSAVTHQPENAEERRSALQALLSCPTASIGTVTRPEDVLQVQASLPMLITDHVYHCGYHAESSYGAASYLIQRPNGNVLVDSPRFVSPLIKQIEALGGIRYLYLTHRDDVADHQKFHDHFGCDRILHQDDVTSGTREVEHLLTGTVPVKFAPDLLIIPVPGHTKGHTVLLYNHQVLFSGDHLAWSRDLGHLFAFRRACWYSWSDLMTSMERLAEYDFEWVLPGHGRRFHSDRETMRSQMQQCLTWMRQQ